MIMCFNIPKVNSVKQEMRLTKMTTADTLKSKTWGEMTKETLFFIMY